MIPATIENLHRGIKLLNSISDEQYSNKTAEPYHSSIGSHIRHVLDVFDCIFEGILVGKIDLTARKRNQLAETKTDFGIAYFDNVIQKLNQLNTGDLTQIIQVSDDLGLGIYSADYTLESILIQAHSHAIHHFASIGYIISQVGIQLPDPDFGYNPTTPIVKTVKI